jgi:hypothetical protein
MTIAIALNIAGLVCGVSSAAFWYLGSRANIQQSKSGRLNRIAAGLTLLAVFCNVGALIEANLPARLHYTVEEISSERGGTTPFGIRIEVSVDRAIPDATVIVQVDDLITSFDAGLADIHVYNADPILSPDRKKLTYRIRSPGLAPGYAAVIKLFSSRPLKVMSVKVS